MQTDVVDVVRGADVGPFGARAGDVGLRVRTVAPLLDVLVLPARTCSPTTRETDRSQCLS